MLLDEVEKAHGDVFNILLQVMDDGRLTDGQGRTVDFKNVVLIMTSNIPGGRAGAEQHFRPEFINRLDDIVEFEPLSREQIGAIVDLQVARLIRRVREREIEVELTDAARTLLGNLGYDPTYGARPLKRVIQKRLVDKLALAILEGEFAAGDLVEVDAVEGELVVHEGGAPRAAVGGGRVGRRRPQSPVCPPLGLLPALGSSDLEVDQQARRRRRSVADARVDLERPRPVAVSEREQRDRAGLERAARASRRADPQRPLELAVRLHVVDVHAVALAEPEHAPAHAQRRRVAGPRAEARVERRHQERRRGDVRAVGDRQRQLARAARAVVSAAR